MCFFSYGSNAQVLILDDKAALDSMKKGVDLVYNFQFEKADQTVKKLKPKYGNHPSFLLFYSIFNFYKNFPIGSKPKEYSSYIKSLNDVILQSEKLKKKHPKSPEPDFYNMMGNLMLARHQSEDGEYIKAVNSTRKAYGFIKKGFDLKKVNSEFYFSTGLYNYYRIAFPENHPIYKSFTVFFPIGDKVLGLKDLEIAIQKSLFSKAEAMVFSTLIYLRDEYNIPQSLKYATMLRENYPSNWLFSILYAECLLESKKSDLAEPIIAKLLMRNESAALLSGYYLRGLDEIQKGNIDAAKWSFQKALAYGKSKDRLTKGFVGLCYGELGKIARDEGKLDWTKKYFKQALDNCSFKKVKQDAKASGF
jgi:hypothetical protein